MDQGLSPTNVVRMKEVWQGEYENFCRRSLEGKRLRLSLGGWDLFQHPPDRRPPLRAGFNGRFGGWHQGTDRHDRRPARERTELAGTAGGRESRGLTESPMLATGDGALGFWKALKQVYPSTRQQRCWVHKTVNVLDKLPHGQQVSAKNMLHEIWMAATKEDALKAMGKFAATYQAKYPKAVECLLKDKEELLAFYDFPAEHWAASAHQQPHRKHVRDGAIANQQNQRSRQTNGLPGDGIQTGRVSTESLAKTQRQHVAAGRDCRSDLQRWNETRRLKLSRPSTTFGNISRDNATY